MKNIEKVEIDWKSKESIEKAERKQNKLNNAGYTLSDTINYTIKNTAILTYLKRNN